MDITDKYSFKTLDKLVIDTSGDKYGVRKNEEEGVKDIRELVHSSKVEGAWAYLPGEEMWIWVAEGEPQSEKIIEMEGKSFYSLKVDLNWDFITKNLFYDYDFTIYHFHTADYSIATERVEKELKEKIPDIDDILVEIIVNDYQKERSLRGALPSGTDISIMIEMSRKTYWVRSFRRKFNEIPLISHKVCSKYGISEYYLTEEGKKFFDYGKIFVWNGKELEANEEEKSKQIEEVYKIMKETREKMISFPLEKRFSSEEFINGIIEEIKHPYFEVVFTPYAE